MSTKYDLKKMSEILEQMELIDSFLGCHFAFDTIWRKELRFREFLNDPSHSLEEKIELLSEIFSAKDCPAFREYILLLLSNNDILKYPLLTEKLLKFLEKRYLIVRLSSATQMNDRQLEKIKTILAAKSAKKVFLYQKIVPQLLGGFVLNFADNIINLSLQHRLQELKTSLG